MPDPSRPQPPARGLQTPLPTDVSAESALAEGVLTAFRLGVMTLVSVDPDPEADVRIVRGFAPGRPMTRADVAAPLVRLWQVLDQECPETAAAPFEDIDDLQVAADAVCLRGLGVTAGTTATTFSPERLVTRAQTASLLIRVWRRLGRDCPADAAAPFDDVAADDVHRDDILCLRGLGITGGTTATTFTPLRHVSRAEFATMLTRLYNLINPPAEPEAEPEVELPDPSRPQSPTDPVALPTDVWAGSVHAEGILNMFRRGIMTLVDVDPGADVAIVRGFAPGRSMTRADVAAPLVRLWQVLDQECPTDTAEPFEDIDDLQLAADAVCLRGLGITAGTTATTFSPERLVTRAQTASLLIRVWQRLGRDCPAEAAAPFDDVAADSVHRDNILCLRALGITTGTGASTFSPGRHVTRAQFATMLTRLYNLINPPTEPEAEPEVEAPTEPETEPEVEAQQTEPETEPEVEAQQTEPEVEVEQPEAEIEVEVEQPEAEIEVEVEQPEAEVEQGDGSEPVQTMTRAEVAGPLVALWQALGERCPRVVRMPFRDVPIGSQARTDVACLHTLGVVGGTTATTYSPDRAASRAEVATMLARIWQLSGRECPAGAPNVFTDVADGSVHRDGIVCLHAQGVTAGTTATTFSPDRPITPVQLAALVTRLTEAA